MHEVQIVATFVCQLLGPAYAMEQGKFKMGLQLPDLMRHRRLGNIQLHCGGCEGSEPGAGLEAA